jgi:2-oxoglutarate ferredoxin oxidoreductase subunit gamma
MSQGAYNKYVPGFRRGGLLIIDEDLAETDEVAEGLRILSIPATRLAEELGRKIVANVVMLGFLTAVTNLASVEAMKKAVLSSVPKGTEELNLKAFERGYVYGQQVKKDK